MAPGRRRVNIFADDTLKLMRDKKVDLPGKEDLRKKIENALPEINEYPELLDEILLLNGGKFTALEVYGNLDAAFHEYLPPRELERKFVTKLTDILFDDLGFEVISHVKKRFPLRISRYRRELSAI